MRILFITPIGGRTGSEMNLWYILKYLYSHSIECAVYTREYGSLFRNSPPIPNTFQHKWPRNFAYRLIETICHKITKRTPEQWYIIYKHKNFKSNLWYLNTITMPEFASLAEELRIPYIVHVHELMSLYDTQKSTTFINMLSKAKAVIACSIEVKNILEQMGLQNIKYLKPFIDIETIKATQTPTYTKSQLLIPENAFIWAMSGSICMRKGIDFVPDLLTYLPKNTYLVWLGSESEYSAYYYVKKRVELENLNFLALGTQSGMAYYNYLNMCDGFVLLSREEPFGLVMAEAAYLEKPIVSFESGGPNEFIEEGMGEIIPNFDLKKMAEAMMAIMNKETIINRQKLKAKALDCDVKNQAPKWLEIIETLSLN